MTFAALFRDISGHQLISLIMSTKPILSQWCELKFCDDWKHSEFLCRLILKKYYNLVFHAEEKRCNIRINREPIVNNKPEKIKVLKLKR